MELDAYVQALQLAISRQASQAQELQSSIDQLQGVQQLVTRLPEKVRHTVMVPYGRHAFFPGQLVHTNEFMVNLGCDYQVEASAVEAAAVSLSAAKAEGGWKKGGGPAGASRASEGGGGRGHRGGYSPMCRGRLMPA